MVNFTKCFTCLGSSVSFLMGGTTDVKNRINKVNKEMGALKSIWDSIEVPVKTKINLCQDMLLDLARQGSEKWIGNRANLSMIDSFHHVAIRLALRMPMIR